MSDQQSAASGDERFTKRSQTIPLRPLLGIHQNVSPTLVPKGAFRDLEGWVVSDIGLIRRSGFQLIEEEPPDIIRWDYLDSFIDDNGKKITFGIGSGVFYTIAGDGFSPSPNTYDTGTASASTTSRLITGTVGTTFWESEGGLARGDTITFTGSGLTYTIDTVGGDESITVLEIPDAIETDEAYVINRLMTPAADWAIQVVRLDRILYIVTGKNTVMCFDLDNPGKVNTWFEQLGGTVPPTPNFIPKCIAVFKNRIWTGNIFSDQDGIWHPTRVSWTPILNPLNFAPDALFTDLVTIGGEIGCVRELGNLLMVYFEFGVQFGRETQIPGDTFPLGFDIAETGRRGVLQPNAVTPARGGHFYVSTDNIYYISQNLQVTPVADEVKEGLFGPNVDKAHYKIMNFYEAEGIAVASTERAGEYDTIWAFNFDQKEWGKFSIVADYVAVFALGSRETYANYPDGQIYGADPNSPCGEYDWLPPDYTTRDPATQYFNQYLVQSWNGGTDMSNGWADIGADPTPPVGPYTPYTTVPLYSVDPPGTDADSHVFTNYTFCKSIYGGSSNISANDRFYITGGRYIYVYTFDKATDQGGSSIQAIMETGDFDLGLADTYKTWYQIAIRVSNRAPQRITYKVSTSDDSGLSWYNMGNLVIPEGGKEGRCNFLHTGSATRFRLTATSDVIQYLVTELTLNVRLKSRQFSDF
jgi:hypothetical protein